MSCMQPTCAVCYYLCCKNITQAGIRAVSDDEYSPIVVYITRDFGVDSDKTYYNSIKEGDKINIKVIGKRFEMNDKHIQIIGFLVHPKKNALVLKLYPILKIITSVDCTFTYTYKYNYNYRNERRIGCENYVKK